MGLSATLLLIGALVIAGLDWFSVATSTPQIESIAKPAVMVLLAAAVVTGGDSGLRWLVIVGLLLSLIGDVALLESVDKFVEGLGAFLFAHIFYAAAFVAAYDSDFRVMSIVIFGLAVLIVLGRFGLAIIAAASREDQRLRVPVTLYIVALSVMLLAASTGNAVGAIGAWLFATSDTVLGWNRFVQPLRNGRLATHILYHAGQALIAGWAIGL